MKKSFRRALVWLRDNWVMVSGVLVIFLLSAGALRLALYSVPAGASPAETIASEKVLDYHAPWHSAVSAPYYTAVNVAEILIPNPVHAARTVSVIIGFLVLISFFWLMSLWFNNSIALIGLITLASSSWFLHTARAGTDSIMLVAVPIALFIFGTIISGVKNRVVALLSLSFITAAALYVPYMAWLLLPTAVFVISSNKRLLMRIKTPWKILAAAVFVITISPLVYAVVNQPSQLKELLGIPKDFPNVVTYLQQLWDTISSISLRSPLSPALRLGRLPLLDIFSSVMLVMGVYFYSVRLSLRRSGTIFICLAASLLIIAIAGPNSPAIALLMAPIYALIVSGLYETIREWLKVFPRNPYARNFGITLLVTAVAFSSFYHLQRYYNAWPNAPETKAIYNSGISSS